MPWSFPGGSGVKNLLAKQEMCSFPGSIPGSIPGWVRKNPWWRACNHSSVLAGIVSRTEEPVGLQCMGLQRVGQD